MSDPSTAWSWTDWAPQRRPGRAILAGGLILVSVGAVSSVDPWMALVGAVFLLASTAEGLLPIHYALNPEGVTRAHLFGRRRQPWRHFDGYERAPEGFWLRGAGPSKFIRKRRAITLRCPGQEEAVETTLSCYLAPITPPREAP